MNNIERVEVLRRRFLTRADVLAFKPPWPDAVACPTDELTPALLAAALLAHVDGTAPAVVLPWRTQKGKFGTETGRFKLGSYSPAPDGTTRWGVVDFDGGAGHKNALADPKKAALDTLRACESVGVLAYLEQSASAAGWHVWVLFDAPIQAALVRAFLFSIVPGDALLLKGGPADAEQNRGVEVFPKADQLLDKTTGRGNQVWLPWWSGAKPGGSRFYRVGPEGELEEYEPELLGADAAAVGAIGGSWLAARAAAKASRKPLPMARKLQRPRHASEDRDAAIQRYNEEHPRTYPREKALCPVCGDADSSPSFCASKISEGRWVCFNARHPAVGFTAPTCHHGDGLDLDAYAAGFSDPIKYLVREGYLTPPTPPGGPGREPPHTADSADAGPVARGVVDELGELPPAPEGPSTPTPESPFAASAPEPNDDRKPFGTDTWLAERFVKEHGQDLRYCGPWKKWHVWHRGRWLEDQKARAPLRMKQTVRDLYTLAGRLQDATMRAVYADFAVKSEASKARAAALGLAAFEREVQVLPREFDSDPLLLNVKNGTLDLRTGKLAPHERAALLTKQTLATYDPDAKAPTWHAFLERVFAGDQEMIGFVRRAAGYSLTGDVGEHALFVLHGNGANGKSTFCETLQIMLGDYAGAGAPNLLIAAKHERHPTELAELFGKRLIICQESGEEHRFDEAKVKAITGGDAITARRMREDFWTFDPTHKLWLCTNHKPAVTGQDDAIWRRINLVPFEVQIPEAERDKRLKYKLRHELPGILAWAVRGYQDYKHIGLAAPEKVKAATRAYRQSEDRLAAFFEDCCVVQRGAFAAAGALYQAYKRWADEAGEFVLSQKAFGQRLTERDLAATKDRGVRGYQGIGLKVREGFGSSREDSAA